MPNNQQHTSKRSRCVNTMKPLLIKRERVFCSRSRLLHRVCYGIYEKVFTMYTVREREHTPMNAALSKGGKVFTVREHLNKKIVNTKNDRSILSSQKSKIAFQVFSQKGKNSFKFSQKMPKFTDSLPKTHIESMKPATLKQYRVSSVCLYSKRSPKSNKKIKI